MQRKEEDSMDANNRQNQSTQTRALQNGGSPQQATLEQNTAFGTAKNPEGFVATWKNATHLWRWRAVLCVFLSLLLTMMQPAGNALYRSWNADTGDMMGLAVALTGTDLTTGGSSDITGSGDGDEDTLLETADYVSTSSTGKIYFFSDWRNDAQARTWIPNMTTGTGGLGSNHNGTAYNEFYDAKTSTYFREGSAYYGKDYVAYNTGDDRTGTDASKGNMGALVWIDDADDGLGTAWFKADGTPAEGSENATTEARVIDWGDKDRPEYWVWSLGYELKSWVGFNQVNFWEKTEGGYKYDSSGVQKVYNQLSDLAHEYVLSLSDKSGAIPLQPKVSAGSDEKYAYTKSNQPGWTFESTQTQTGFKNQVYGGGKYYDIYLYALWKKRADYTLKSLDANQGYLWDNSGLTKLSWDSNVNVKSDFIDKDSGCDETFTQYLLNDVSWAVCSVDSSHPDNALTAVSLVPNELLSQTVALGKLLNAKGLDTPDIDPWSKSSPYYDADKNGVQDGIIGTVSISPVMVVTYDPNGGTGGATMAMVAEYWDEEDSGNEGYDIYDYVYTDLSKKTDERYIQGITTVADGGTTGFVSKRNSEFLGWATRKPTAESPLTENDVVFSKSWLDSNAGTKTLKEALDEKDLNPKESVIDEDEWLKQDITLYAVWENTGTTEHEVNYLRGGNDASVKISKTSDYLKGGKAISSLATDDATANPAYVAPKLLKASDGTPYDGPKYSGEFEWSAKIHGTNTSQDVDEATPTEGDPIAYDVTLTPKLATYTVTVDAAHGTLGTGATEILDVPYGTAYSDIYYKPGNAAEGTDPAKFYFTTDTTNGLPITTAATNGKGSRGQFADKSGNANATWSGLWSDSVVTRPSTTASNNIADGGTDHPTKVASLANTAATVTGPTTLTFDYDKGYNALSLEVASKASNATTGLTGDKKTAVETAQSTSDLSLSYTTVYVPYDSWTATGVESAANWYAQNGSSAQGNYPTASRTGGNIGDKYATVTDSHSNGTETNYVAWSGFPKATDEQVRPDGESRLPDSSASKIYKLTATPTLKTYEITVTVDGSSGNGITSNGGTVTTDANGNPITNPTSSGVVGSAKWGEYADTVINASVIGGITPGNTAGYTTTGATWSPDPAATQVSNTATTYTVQLAKTLHEVTVNFDGGKINGDGTRDTTTGITTGTFIVYDVPYNTKVEDIRYDKSKTKTISSNTGYQYTNAAAGGTVVALDVADTAKTDLDQGRNKSGSWTSTLFEANTGYATLAAAKTTDSQEDPTILEPQTLNYEFGRDEVTVEFVINNNVIPDGASDPGGTWAESGTGIVTGKVPYGKTLADAVTLDETPTALGIPNPANITITDTNQYKNDSSSHWDTTPTSTTVVAPTTGSSGNWKATYSYYLTTRDDLSVVYNLPTAIDQAGEVEFATSASYNHVTYGGVRSSVTPEPTAIQAKSGVDATMVAKKYNLTGFTWTPGLDDYVNSDLSYTANITLREYGVEYSIVNGSWGTNVNSTDGTTYHYGDTPQSSYTPSGGSATSIPMASLGASGTHNAATNTVVPTSGYEKTETATNGAWEGVWEMRVSNDGKSTWTTWGPLTDLEGNTVATPSAVDITGDTQFRLKLKRVVSVTFQSDTTSITGNGPAAAATQYFAGDTLTAPTVSASIEAATGYKKSDGSKSGHWYNKATGAEGVPTTVPDSADPLVYEYALYAVHTATYHIEHGTWTNPSGYIQGENGALKEEVFANVGVTPPASSSANASVYNLALVWYDGASTASGTARSSAPSGTISTDVDYTAYYGSNKSYTYTVEFYTQNTELNGYDKYATYTDTTKKGGDTVEVTAAILAANTPQAKISAPDGAFTISAVDTDNNINTDLNKQETVEGNITHKIYYDRNTFSYTYAYTYDSQPTKSAAFIDAITALPNPATTANVPYGAQVTLDTAAASTTNYTFSGWQPSYTPSGGSATNVPVSGGKFTMPAGNVDIVGNWTRNAVTITLTNNDTAKGHIQLNGGDVDTSGPITITGYQYGDTLDLTGYKVEGINGQYFAGWLDVNDSNNNIGQTLPTQATAVNMSYLVEWSDKVKVAYVPDTKYNDSPIATFTAQGDQTWLDPGSNITAFDTTTYDPATAHKDGYTFLGWEWANGTQQALVASDAAFKTQPKSGNTTVTLEFKPLYEGTAHQVTYSLNGGTQITSNAAKMTEGTFTAHTGDKVWLPSTSELTRQGCTLRGFSIKVGAAEAYEKPATAAGELFMIPAGSAGNSFTDAITITAVYDTQVTFSYEKPATMTLPADIAAAISAASGTKALGASVDLPTVTEGGNQKVVSQATIPTGYHFAGWETNYNALTIGDEATSFTVPGATTDTIPAAGLTVKAKWAIDQYRVSWAYNESPHSEYDFTFPSDPNFDFDSGTSTIDYNTAGASVTVPQLKGPGSGELSTAKYTATNVDWMLKYNDQVTDINIKDITFGVPFYIASDGKTLATSAGDGATEFTWADGAELTFVGVPVINEYDIVVAVTNGTMNTSVANTASTTANASVTYHQKYGTNYSEFLPESIAGYSFTADEEHDQNSGGWISTVTDPFGNGLFVTGDASYTYDFPTVKTYTVVYQLSSDYTDDAGLIELTSTGTTATWGTTYTTTSFPTLQVNAGAATPMNSSTFNSKYYTALSWVRATTPTTPIVTGTSYTYNDSQVTTDTSVAGDGGHNLYPQDKIITFIGTPQTKSYSISINVSGGSFKSGVTGVGADGKLLVDANAVYGKPLADYLDAHVTDFERDASHMSTGHWEYGGTRVDTATDTVQHTTAVYTYVFDAMRTVTLQVNDGKFANNTGSTKTYYVPDDGTANATLANAADPETGTYAFTGATEADRQAAAKQALLLEPQNENAGFEWNTTGWTSTAGAGTLVAEAHNPAGVATTGSFNYPDVTAQISSDVTFTYAFAAKPVTVKFTQMFQKAEPDTSGTFANDYETLQVTEGGNQVDRYVNWVGTYSTTPVTVADWAGRILADATLKGYNTTPVKVTSDAAGQNPITEFSRENWQSTDQYYLWYDRLKVSYGYNYTNPSDAPASASSAPAGSTDPIRWGQTVKLANPLDSTYAKALDGWYLTNNAGTLSNKAAALNADYTFKPAYTGSPTTPIAVTLHGTWGQASYAVTFANAASGDPNDDSATFTLNSTAAAAGASVTTAPILYGDPIGTNKPTVTVSFADKYSHVGWKLYIGDNANCETSIEFDASATGATIGADGLIADEDLPYVLVKGPNYVFKPVFKLNQITIKLEGGGHQDLDPVTTGDTSTVAWVTTTVDYGSKVYLPTLAEWQAYKNSSTDNQSRLDANGVILPYEADKYAVKAKGNKPASEPLAWLSDEDNAAWPTDQDENGYYLTATKNLTFQYQWENIKYKVEYRSLKDGNSSDIHAIVGQHTEDSLTWGASVFDAKLSTNTGTTAPTVRQQLGTFNSGTNAGMDKVLYPTWEGHEFLGWQAGNSAAAAQGTFTRGQDITISQAYRPSLVTANDYTVYLWALWSGEKKTVTFYKNDENAGTDAEATATQDIEIDVETNLTPIADWRAFDREGFGFEGWATSRAGNVVYANKAPFTVHSTDTAENLKLYAKWHPSVYKVQFAYFDGTPMTVKDVTGSGSDESVYEQEMTYGQLATLTTVNLDAVNATGENSHNPDGDVFAGWSYKTEVFENGQAGVSNLTSEDGGTVLLTPVSAGKVKLHYVANAGTDTVTDMPATNPDTGSVITDTTNTMYGYAPFTLPSAPTRDGYTFAGWQVYGAKDASGNAITGVSAAGDTIYLDGATASYIAYAQWTAAEQTGYIIVRERQKAVGSSEYEEFYREVGNKAPTGSWVEIGVGSLASFKTQLDGYLYMPALSTTKVQVTADGKATIVLKYNLEALSVTYAFTEGGLPLAGDVAGLSPFGDNSTVNLTGNNAVITLKLPTDPALTLPEGYEIASGYTDKWNYNSATQALKDAPETGEPAAILTNEVAADGTTKYTVVGDAVLTLPIQKKKFTVTFAHDANTLWSDESTAATKVVSNVTYGDAVDPDGDYPAGTSVGASVKPAATEGYGFGGWIYTNNDDASDPLNGTIVDPATTQVKNNVTFTATHFESFTVTWLPGGNSASAFSHTPEAQRLFTQLPATGYLWESDGSDTRVAGLQLEAADEFAVGVPLAQDGYQFIGWKATCDASIKDDNGATVNGTTYESLDDLYAVVPPSHDYTFTAQWEKLVQTVLFNPNVSGGAASGQIISAIQGYSGETVDLDGNDAKTPAAPQARPGYAFDYWRGVIGGKIVRLSAEQAFTFPMNKLGVTDMYTAVWKDAIIDILPEIGTYDAAGTTFTAGNGTVEQNQAMTQVRAKDTTAVYTLKANPDPGYKFVRWETSVTGQDISSWYDGSITDKSSSAYGLITLEPVGGAYQEATYRAVLQPDPYQVSFENSATPGEGTVAVTYDTASPYTLVERDQSVDTTAVSVSATPSSGYTFLGWTYKVWPETADPDTGALVTATEPVEVDTPVRTEDLGTVPIIGRTVFTAKYAAQPASLTYDKNADAATGNIGAVTGKVTGDEVTLPSTGYTWAGHTLLGWASAPSTGTKPPASMTADEFDAYAYKAGRVGTTYKLKGGAETLYAVYLADQGTLYFDNNATNVDNLAIHAVNGLLVNANEEGVAPTIAAVGWTGGDLATQPGYVSTDATHTKVPGGAREFVGWSYDPDANPENVDGTHGGAPVWAPGSAIPIAYMPSSSADTTKTLYAIWKDKTFTVTLAPNGGTLKSGATAPANPLVSGVKYGESVSIPALMYERNNGTFLYWLADDANHTTVSDSTGAAASYKFAGTSNVTLTAKWKMDSNVQYKVSVVLKDENGQNLTSSALGPYALDDTPLYGGAYENLTVTGSTATTVSTENTGAYFDFDGWYIFNTFKANEKVTPTSMAVAGIVQMYDGRVQSSGFPKYWENGDYTSTFNQQGPAENVLTLYAKKTLKNYDVAFDPNVPADSGYTATSVTSTGSKDAFVAKVVGETKTLADNGTYGLPGYRFLGWLTSQPTNQNAITPETFAAKVSSGDAVSTTYSLANPLLKASSTKHGVTLYAAWADTDNTVTFVSRYDGSGVSADDGATTETAHATQQHKTWTSALDPVATLEKHPADAEASFAGWYTANGKKVELGSGANQCDSVADILAVDSTLQPKVDGSYDIKLYAHYTYSSARVVYNGDAGAIAPATLPATQVAPINSESTSEPTATITLLKASDYLYRKAGYHMDGWEGKGNTATYNGGNASYYNSVWKDSDGDAARTLNFDKNAAGTTINVYPHYEANSYTVNYDYTVPEGYQSYIMTAAVPGQDASGDVTQKTGLGWGSGSVYATNLFSVAEPILEGYELTGWTYTTSGGKTVTVKRGWTVENLVNAAVLADPDNVSLANTKFQDSTFTLKAVWTPKTYAVSYDADGGVMLGTTSGPIPKTGIAWTASTDPAGDNLLIEASKLNKADYSNPVWYVDANKTVAANTMDGAGETPTFANLVYLYHQAAGHPANGGATYSIDKTFSEANPLPLYAKWQEDTATVVFTVSNAAAGYIALVSEDGTATQYNDSTTSQVVYTVGKATGAVKGKDGLTIDKVSVQVGTTNGYSVSGWKFGTDTVAAAGTLTYTVPHADHYGGGIYVAQIAGNGNADMTLRYFDMDTTGAYPATATETASGLTAAAFNNVQGSAAGVGDVIPAANLGTKRASVPDGLSLDEGKLANYTVKVSGNVADVYYKRATVDVDFEWAWPDGAPATSPALPASYQSVYYGTQQATPAAPTAPQGYTFDGWYLGGTKLGATIDVNSTSDMKVVGRFSKASYTVSFTGVYGEDGVAAGTKLSGDGVPTMTPASLAFTTPVEFGQTLGRTIKIDLIDGATANKVFDRSLGAPAGATDLTVNYDSSRCDVSWAYTKDGGATWLSTADPTSVIIEGDTEFRLVSSNAQVISYMAGDHGAFATKVSEGTRAESVPAGYDMAGYLYNMRSADGKKQKAGPAGADGLPLGQDGWVFAGWKWEYALPQGYMQEGPTDEVPDVADLKGLVHGITLTAQWEPGTSYLKLDLNDQDVPFDNVVRASYASDYKSPEGLQPTYDPTLDNAVTLPDAEQVTREGFTLQKWVWETTDGAGHAVAYEYAPGAEFQMPGSSKKQSDDPAVTLKAVWAEEYATINYYSTDNTKGTVTVSSETVGVWTGKVRGSTSTPVATLGGSQGFPVSEKYEFTKWTKDDRDGAALQEATGLRPDGKVLPQRVSKTGSAGLRYYDADYYATFTGKTLSVMFGVDDASTSKGRITVNGAEKTLISETRQDVPYGEPPVMDGNDQAGNKLIVKAEPKGAEYETGDGRFWDYYINTGTSQSPVWEKQYSVYDPTEVEVTAAESLFKANFKDSAGTYPVNFDTRKGTGTFGTVYKAWGDANVGAGKTPRRPGYDFTGWFATPYGQTYASATDAMPGMLAAVSSTYGQLVGNDAFATRAKTEGVTLLAGWSEKSGYAVTASANGGDFVDAGGTATGKTTSVSGLKWTSTVTNRLATPKRAGYDFVGWSTQREGTPIAATTKYGDLAGNNDDAPGNVTLYAQWAEKTYLVRYMNYPRSNSDPITRAGDVSFTRQLKYGDAVATAEPYNSKSDDRAWNCWAVATGGAAAPNQDLKDTTLGWTVADLEANGVSTDPADGAFIVYGTWINYITWTTTYVLYDDVYAEPARSPSGNQEGPGDDFANPKAATYLKVTSKALPGANATPDFDRIPPGFQYNEDMTVKYNNNTYGTNYTTADDMFAELTTATGNLNFDVVVVAKIGYSLAFDMNDENTAFPNGYKHKATTGADAGNASTYPTQLVKDFYKIHNVPWSVYDRDNTDEGVALADPTRPGFAFAGWHTLVAKDTDASAPRNDIESNADMYFGDLAYDSKGNWYDPMVTSGGVMTLHARWTEMQRVVRYNVASDMTQLVRIRLQSEAEGAFSTAERTETIGAATGDLFVNGVRKTRAQVPSGAVAEANRGYTAQWRIVVDDAAAQAMKYDMPFKTGMEASSLSVLEAAEAVTGAFMPSDSVVRDVSADIVTAASGASKSSEGALYSATAAITPGVVGDANAADYGLFAGKATNEADTTAHDVQYVAVVVENAGASIKIDPDGGKYTGAATTSQPYGTYIGESAPWGLTDGKLPAADTISRWGYTFNGWIVPAGTKYVDSRGLTKTITSTMTVKPTDDMAKRIVVPAGGITLKAAWTLNANATVKIDANGGKYTGTASWTQPALTYIGEKSPWGSTLGALPSGDGATRWGYDFDGYIVPAGTQYTDGSTVKTLSAATTVKPADDLAKRLIVPTGGITLKIAWKEKAAATVAIDANGGTYSGTASWVQPQSTYVGEKSPWGSGLGALPAASTVTRTNFRFDGWVVPAGTQYADASGNVKTLSSDTTVLPTSDMAKRIILPAKGLTLKAAWTETIVQFGDDVVISKLPDVDYTSYGVTNPALKVTLNGKTLAAGTDYTAVYTNNVEVGTATVTVTGKGLYKGTKSATFRINHIADKQGFVDLDKNEWYMTTDLTPGSNAGNFKGIETLYLDLVFARELMTGYRNPDGTYTRFGPNDMVTRAQAATILYRIANAGKTDTYNPSDYAKSNTTGLPDVETGQYYTAAVNWAQREGVVTGYGTPGHYYAFGPYDNVTREQMATMIARFCVQYYGKANKSQALNYKDGSSISSWAAAGVQYCSAVGIMAGYGTSGVFGPQDNATRCQVGKIVAVAVHEVIDK